MYKADTHMKRKKTLKLLATVLGVFTLGLGTAACNFNFKPVTPEQEETEDARIREIYELAVASGATTLTYEEWIASIRGENGQDGKDGTDGLTPYIGDNGHWWIGNTDTGVSAQGPSGQDGKDGTDGQDGKDGADGQDGAPGTPGQDGEDGTSLHTGSGIPSNSLGNDGDSYIDLSTWNFYVKANGVWTLSGNIKGAQGSPGSDGNPGTPGIPGEDGNPGSDGLSAYQIYLQYHSEYTKTEAEWLDDLINGRLGTQQIHVVTFDSGEGSAVSPQQVLHGEKAVKPISPTRAGYNFTGWVDENGDRWVFNGFSITSDITLYATWEAEDPGHVHTFSDEWSYNNEQHYHAATCGHDVVIDTADHTFNDVVTPPTYESGGYTTHTCTVCGYSYTDSEVPALVHYTITVGAIKTSLETGENTNLTIESSPSINFEEAFANGDLVVHNDNSSVIEINSNNGTATAVGPGTAHVYVTYLGVDDSNMVEFTVSDPAPAPTDPVNITFYAFNDLHGALVESSSTAGISKTATYLKEQAALTPENDTVVISQGDMFQGSFESNSNQGKLVTEWMNECGFVSMTYGNHEYDWGIDNLVDSSGAKALAEFPFLAINIMYNSGLHAGERAAYADASTVITRNGVKIGIIGAIGNCKSSIEADLVEDVYFATGNELTNLVKSESTRLRNDEHCDFIVYSLHSATMRTDTKYDIDPYDITLSSEGYVDVVFESHTHDQYCLQDTAGVYHMQGSSYGKGLYKYSVNINPSTDTFTVDSAEYVSTSTTAFKSLSSDSFTDNLLNNKYYDATAYQSLGTNSESRNSNQLRQIIADEYLRLGKAKWSTYDIVLGGGYMSCRSPYSLAAGDVTYAKLYELFPFDNRICLCSVPGEKLKTAFMRNTSSQSSYYFISYADGHSDSDYDSIDESATYYVVTDTYSGYYSWNQCTIIDFYEPQNYYQRDILRQYAIDGHFNTGGGGGGEDPYVLVGDGSIANPYTVTDTSHAAEDHISSSALFAYYKGEVKTIPGTYNSNGFSNIVLTDGVTDLTIGRIFRTDAGGSFGNAFNNLPGTLEVGDEIIFAGAAYDNGGVMYSYGNVVISVNGIPMSGKTMDDPMTVKQLRLGQCGEHGTAYYEYLNDGNKLYLIGTISNLVNNGGTYSFTLGTDATDLSNGRWNTDPYGKYLNMYDVTVSGAVDTSSIKNSVNAVVSYDCYGNYEIVKIIDNHGKSADDPLTAAEAYEIGSSSDVYYVQGAVSRITTAYNSDNGKMSFDVDCGDGTFLRFYNVSVTQEQATLFATKGVIAIGYGKLAIYGGIHEINGTTIADCYSPTEHSIIEVSGGSSVFVGNTLQLSATSYPESLGQPGSYTWQSANPLIATVDENGLVTGVGDGEVQITVSNGSATKRFTISVTSNTHGLIESDPLSGEEAKNIAAGLESGTSTPAYYYIQGVVDSISDAYSSWGNASFYIQAGSGTFYIYRCYADATNGAALKVGSTVLIYARLQNYGGTPETVQGGSNFVVVP